MTVIERRKRNIEIFKNTMELYDNEALDKIANEIVALFDEENKVIPLLEFN